MKESHEGTWGGKWRKLKTPETEASGVSILVTSSTTGCCVLRFPGANLQLSLPLFPRAQASFKNLRLSPTAPDSGLTGGQLPRLGSAFCPPAQPVAKTPDFRRLFRTSDRPLADLPAFAGVSPRARLATTSDSHLVLILQLGWLNGPRFSPIAVRSFRLAPSATATSSSHWLLPLLPYRRWTSDSRRLFNPPALPVSIRPACATRFYLRLGL